MKEKDILTEATTLPTYESDSERSQENDVVQVGEKFSAFGEQFAISLVQEYATNFVAV